MNLSLWTCLKEKSISEFINLAFCCCYPTYFPQKTKTKSLLTHSCLNERKRKRTNETNLSILPSYFLLDCWLAQGFFLIFWLFFRCSNCCIILIFHDHSRHFFLKRKKFCVFFVPENDKKGRNDFKQKRIDVTGRTDWNHEAKFTILSLFLVV